MRRVAGLLLLPMLTGCYLFSDEPKARKKPGSEVGNDDDDEAEAEPKPQPRATVDDCPEYLTGVENRARTIAASCGPVRVRGQYRIDGGSLTLEPGVELRFDEGAVLEVGRDRPGLLRAAGTPARPIRLVAGEVGEGGGWKGVKLHAQAAGSALKHVEIASAGTADDAALWIAAEQLEVEGLTIRAAASLGLEVVAERGPTLLGVDISGAGIVARVSPSAAAGLQELKLEPSAVVAVASGKITGTIEWPANVHRIEGIVRIEGAAAAPAALTIAPGASLWFTPEARVIIGGFGPGSLSASASPPMPEGLPPPPDAPDGSIRLRAAEDTRPGSWSGIHVQDQGALILRNVELAHGGARDEGVVLAEAGASVTLEGCRFVDNAVGVELRGAAVTVAGLTQNSFVTTPVAIRTTPALLAGLGPDNHYDELAQIHVERGRVEADATWTRQDAIMIVHGDVFVDKGATLVVAPGSRLGFIPGVVLGVGYYEEAALDMRGTAEAPIVLEPAPSPEEPQPWGGVVLGAHARKVRFEHVRLRGTANAAGIELRDEAEATLVNVECSACANATVRWDCDSKIGNIAVTAGPGTPTALAPPSGCK